MGNKELRGMIKGGVGTMKERARCEDVGYKLDVLGSYGKGEAIREIRLSRIEYRFQRVK